MSRKGASDGMRKRAVINTGDLEKQEKIGAWAVDSHGHAVDIPTDQYGRPLSDVPYAHDGLHYSGWVCSWYNLCWGLACVLATVFIVLGLIGFIVALHNESRITAVESTTVALTSTVQSQQAQIDSQLVPFDHTAAGPIQTKVKKQYISVAAVAAMTLPGDLSPYLNDEICIISKTAFAHTVTMGAGATWDGANQVATFGGAANDGLCFIVTSSTGVFVTANNNVGFS